VDNGAYGFGYVAHGCVESACAGAEFAECEFDRGWVVGVCVGAVVVADGAVVSGDRESSVGSGEF